MYIYCVVCYHVIAALYVRSIVMTLPIVKLFVMIWNAQWTMISLLLLKVISSICYE